jgi:hypothetical protein
LSTDATLEGGIERSDETRQLSYLDQFVGSQHTEQPELPPQEVAKLDALRDDIVWLQRRDANGNAAETSALATIFARYEHRWGKPPRHERAEESAPPPRPPQPAPYDAETHVFDRLSIWYGGQYRGAIVFVYRLAMLAALFAIAERSAGPFGLLSWLSGPHPDHATWIPFLHWLGEYWRILCGGIEIVLIGAIVAFFLVGRTPRAEHKPVPRARVLPRRWHERWIEYRVLAERFRYASLLQGFARPVAELWRAQIGAALLPSWHDRYFLWRLRVSPPPTQSDADWYAHVIDTMDQQLRYHANVHQRRGSLSHRLHEWSTRIFWLAFGLLALQVVCEWLEAHFEPVGAPAMVLHAFILAVPYVSALLTVIAAAMHGVLGTAEFANIAENSRQIRDRIEDLRRRMLERQAANAPRTECMEDVETFCRLVTDEASGWQALLRDKNMPLTHF